MFRVRDASGALVGEVEFELQFHPEGRLRRTSKTASSGLCLVHWPEAATSLSARLRSGDDWAEVEVPRVSDRPSYVIEVQLSPSSG